MRETRQDARDAGAHRRLSQALALVAAAVLLMLVVVYGPLTLLEYFWFLTGSTLLSLQLRWHVGAVELPRSQVEFVDTSWHGQAGFILAELDRKPLPPRVARLVVDIGAHDGIWQSNSHPFLQAGWEGLLVEADKRTYTRLQRNVGRRFPAARLVRAAVTPEAQGSLGRVVTRGWLDGTENRVEENVTACAGDACVKLLPLPRLLAQGRVPNRFGFLSLDVEWGPAGTARALRAMLAHGFRPEIICAENAERFAWPLLLQPLGYGKLLHARYDTVFGLRRNASRFEVTLNV